MADIRAAHLGAQFAFIASMVLSGENGVEDLKAKKYSDAMLDGDDMVMGMIGASGTKSGYALSSVYFLGRSTGFFDNFASLIVDTGQDPLFQTALSRVPL